MDNDLKRSLIKLMVTIVERGKGERIAELCLREHLHFHFICLGLGTASSEILDYFGLGETAKDVVISMVPDYKVPELMPMISEQMQLKKPGRGIAFTIPLCGISGLISQALTHEQKHEIESEVKKMENSAQYDLIVAVVNQGCTDQVMEAAKKMGATGGTVLHARGVGQEETEKFFGITIQAEKEIVAMLTTREKKQGILQAVNAAAGLKTDARGIILALPVDGLAGL